MFRVRYSRNYKNAPKNTLVTIRKDDTIYFGISRCNSDFDRPNKEIGKALALKRAEISATGAAGSWYNEGSLQVHKSGLLGRVDRVDIVRLLEYFDKVDEYCRERGLEQNQ